jgi:hypothetical protein
MVKINLTEISNDELSSLLEAIKIELKSRKIVDYLIDDSNRIKTRDTIASYYKVFPKGIVEKDDGYHATTQNALEWVEERAGRLGWNLIEL